MSGTCNAGKNVWSVAVYQMVKRVILPLPPACGPLSSARCHALTCASLCLLSRPPDRGLSEEEDPESSRAVRARQDAHPGGWVFTCAVIESEKPRAGRKPDVRWKARNLIKKDPYSKQNKTIPIDKDFIWLLKSLAVSWHQIKANISNIKFKYQVWVKYEAFSS